MASTLHTEKFVVEVQYKGKRRTFKELFNKRNIVKEYEAESTEHNVQKISKKPIRSMDERTIRTILRQAVSDAGYKVSNTAKAKLKDNEARVDYAKKYNFWNKILDIAYHKINGDGPNSRNNKIVFSIYLPHIYIAASFENNNLNLVSGWYCDVTGKLDPSRKITNKLYLYQYPQRKMIDNGWTWVWRPDYRHNRGVLAADQTISLSDPLALSKITQFINNLTPEKTNARVKQIIEDAQKDVREQIRDLIAKKKIFGNELPEPDIYGILDSATWCI